MLNSELLDVEYAFKQIEFAYRLMVYCEDGCIDKKKFTMPLTIQNKRDILVFPDRNFQSDEDIALASQINVSVCFGVSAIVLDALFEKAEIKPNPDSPKPIDKLRTLVYMVRCAFAHNFAKPCWKAQGSFKREIHLDLDGSNLSVDMESLDGKEFDYSYLGLENWYKIKEKAVQLIRDG